MKTTTTQRTLTVEEFLDWFYTEQDYLYDIEIGGTAYTVVEESHNTETLKHDEVLLYVMQAPDAPVADIAADMRQRALCLFVPKTERLTFTQRP